LRRNQNSQSNESSSIVTPESNTQHQADEPMLISTSLWGFLSPSAKKKVKSKLQNEQLPKGMNYQFRKELGINLSIKTKNTDSTTALQKSIEDFFLRDDVTRVCPETKKLKRNPNDLDEELPLRYRMSTLRSLYDKFIAESSHSCSYSYFSLNCPYYVEKPSPNDWGTCLCRTCLNPEIKLEALAKALNDKSFKWDDTKDYNDIKDMIKRIEHLTFNKTITFSEWQMVEQNDKKGKKFSRKVLVTLDFAKFGQRLVKELNVMHDHQYRVHSQFKAFKMAREEAKSNADIATIQLDWSENAKMHQSREEKSAYYHEDSVCLHPMYIWTKQCNYSRTAISDCTDHKAPAVMTSIQHFG